MSDRGKTTTLKPIFDDSANTEFRKTLSKKMVVSEKKKLNNELDDILSYKLYFVDNISVLTHNFNDFTCVL